MNNIDVELYMNQFVNFFDNNPNDLMVLIGNLKKDMFYDLVRDQCEKNLYSGTEVSLTQHQIIEIVVKLKNIDLKNPLTFSDINYQPKSESHEEKKDQFYQEWFAKAGKIQMSYGDSVFYTATWKSNGFFVQ